MPKVTASSLRLVASHPLEPEHALRIPTPTAALVDTRRVNEPIRSHRHHPIMKILAYLWLIASTAFVAIVAIQYAVWPLRSALPPASPLRWLLRLPLPEPTLGFDWPNCWPLVLGFANQLCAALLLIWLKRNARLKKGGRSEA